MSASRVGNKGERWSLGALSEAPLAARVEGTPEELRLLASLGQADLDTRKVEQDEPSFVCRELVRASALDALGLAARRLTDDLGAALAALDPENRAALEQRAHAARKMARTVQALLVLRDDAMGRLRSQGPS